MPALKPIFVVLAIQTVLLLFLAYRVMSLETRASDLTAKIDAYSTGSAAVDAAGKSSDSPFATSSLTADATRKIIREEIAPLIEKLAEFRDKQADARQSFRQRSAGGPDTQPANTMSQEDIAQLRARITQQMNSLSLQGSASQTEIAKLEQDMARLPPEQRIKAFAALNRAINQGRIKTNY